MMSKITFSEFEKIIKDLHPKDLESLVFDIFSLRENLDSLEFNPIIENRQFDLILSEDSNIDDDVKNHWVVEIKSYKSLIPIDIIEQFYTKVKFPRSGGGRGKEGENSELLVEPAFFLVRGFACVR